MLQWKSFKFFEKELVKETQVQKLEIPLQPNENSSINQDTPTTFLQKLVIKSSTSGKGRLIFGDDEGFIHFVDRDFSHIDSFKCFSGSVDSLKQIKNILIALGNDDEEGISPTVKFFNLDRSDKQGNPFCIRSIKLAQKTNVPVPATCLEVTDDLSHLAVGLCNGIVVLIKGDLIREKTSKQMHLQPQVGHPVTGVGFRIHQKEIILFVISTSSVSMYHTSGKVYQEVLDEEGAGANCSIMTDDKDMVVGKKKAVFFYNPHGLGKCYAFEGDKKLLAWHRNYLLVVGQDPNNLKFNSFYIYDLKNELIAYSENRFQNITQVVSEWGMIYILCGDGKIWQLEEKDFQTKLEVLFRRHLYKAAINLASAANYDPSLIADIYTKNGNYLYEKGEFDESIKQYVKTIGYLEPSYVIQKFLDSQRIHNLTSYLQELHEKGLANPDHTTLLFNCYTKLKDETKLDQFIKREENLNFEIETAIKACRLAGYYKHALYLAKRHNDHDSYVKILIEDTNEILDALNYISNLSFEEADNYSRKYGKALMQALPQQTTALLMNLCTNFGNDPSLRSDPDNFIHIFVGKHEWLIKFLEFLISKGKSSTLMDNTLLELYLRDSDNNNALISAENLLTNPKSQYDPDHALILCKMYDFQKGILYLYEKISLFKEIIQYHMEHNQYDLIIEACNKYSDQPDLWIQALNYFAGKVDCQKQITECLNHIDRANLLPPLSVIQILSKNQTATISLVKEYLSRRLEQENHLTQEDKKIIKTLSEQTSKMKERITELNETVTIFQVSKCRWCTKELDLPSVHFLCMHSFHSSCLGENENECPVCGPENKKILEMKKNQEENSVGMDSFTKHLQSSIDGFSTVAEYFGKGIFNAKTHNSSSQLLGSQRTDLNRNF